ncbi:rhodanese-like domain-containing protein [Candidatus Saccharibacteria bacterium]|nr:rhodanese-like domain-containing protein [Candidatus Saccharibacteria bacterium]
MNNKPRNITIAAFCALLFLSIGFFISNNTRADKAETEEIVYQKLSALEARNMMNENNNFILLDVRTEEEFAESRIDGAILIPDYEIPSRAEAELDKEALIFIYCQSGKRSSSSARELIDMGFKRVYDIGGIMYWPYGVIN